MVNDRAVRWEKQGEALLPRYILFWLGGQLLLNAASSVLSLRTREIVVLLPEWLLAGFLHAVIYGVFHVGCLLVLESRGYLSRRGPVILSLGIGAAVGGGVLAAATPLDALFPFRMLEGVPLILPYLAGAWAVGRAWQEPAR